MFKNLNILGAVGSRIRREGSSTQPLEIWRDMSLPRVNLRCGTQLAVTFCKKIIYSSYANCDAQLVFF